MIRKSITRRISRRARRLKVRWSRGWTRLPKAERTTIERRERDGRPSQRPLGSLTQATALALPI
jgi:hypothetical protein